VTKKAIIKIVVFFLIGIGIWSCDKQTRTTYYYPTSFYRSNQIAPEGLVKKPYTAANQRDSSNITLGWHPYYLKNAYESYDFSILHTVIFQGYEWRGDNTEAVIDEWYETEMVDAARAAGCKVYFSASNNGALRNKYFFDSLSLQYEFMDELFAYLKMKDADGIELDFPAVGTDDRADFTQFIKTFYIRLKQINPDAGLYLSLPFFDKNNAFDIRAISPFIDLFILGGNNNANSNYDLLDNEPIAPIQNSFGNDSSSITGAFKHYSEKGINPFQIVLELPYFTTVKKTETVDVEIPKLKIVTREPLVIDTIGYVDTTITEHYHASFSYAKFQKDFGERKVFFDEKAMSSYVNIENPNGSGDIRYYFDDSTSLGAKYDWALERGFRGVGVWALGFDNGYTELWRMLDNRSKRLPSAIAANPPFSIGSYFSRNHKMLQVWFSLVLAVVCIGFLIAMLHWKSRDGLTDLNTFRFYLLIIGGMILFFILSRFLFDLSIFKAFPIIATIIGILLGVVLTFIINGFIDKEIQREP
jgi:hypothetical protein